MTGIALVIRAVISLSSSAADHAAMSTSAPEAAPPKAEPASGVPAASGGPSRRPTSSAHSRLPPTAGSSG